VEIPSLDGSTERLKIVVFKGGGFPVAAVEHFFGEVCGFLGALQGEMRPFGNREGLAGHLREGRREGGREGGREGRENDVSR